MGFWNQLNSFWHAEYSRTRARPKPKAIQDWYAANAERVWGANPPSYQECQRHANRMKARRTEGGSGRRRRVDDDDDDYESDMATSIEESMFMSEDEEEDSRHARPKRGRQDNASASGEAKANGAPVTEARQHRDLGGACSDSSDNTLSAAQYQGPSAAAAAAAIAPALAARAVPAISSIFSSRLAAGSHLLPHAQAASVQLLPPPRGMSHHASEEHSTQSQGCWAMRPGPASSQPMPYMPVTGQPASSIAAPPQYGVPVSSAMLVRSSSGVVGPHPWAHAAAPAGAGLARQSTLPAMSSVSTMAWESAPIMQQGPSLPQQQQQHQATPTCVTPAAASSIYHSSSQPLAPEPMACASPPAGFAGPPLTATQLSQLKLQQMHQLQQAHQMQMLQMQQQCGAGQLVTCLVAPFPAPSAGLPPLHPTSAAVAPAGSALDLNAKVRDILLGRTAWAPTIDPALLTAYTSAGGSTSGGSSAVSSSAQVNWLDSLHDELGEVFEGLGVSAGPAASLQQAQQQQQQWLAPTAMQS
ncbi:hypothetical protein HXX76_011341 [Chlamydomonas incerta]|uniref:Uncharacterized protein n=1 Tax=Chlamydomonas incerta TaxID=51695 RepID=A0A835SKE5_CHLIN|nr:hypothetical protein HXX76_011341 [Chlamydomonas incerta]|eukprot:KAG2428634.1 hypothetical protein HXX76_011341 [Chlamydomonas incerta]